MLSKNSFPLISINLTAAPKKVGLSDPRVLIIGQSYGIKENKNFDKDVQESNIEEYYGNSSLLYWALKTFYKYSKNEIKVDAIALKNPGAGGGSEGGFTFEGTATETKQVTFRPFDDQFKITIQITKGDESTAVCGALTAAINANSTLPFTASQDLTKDNKVCKITARALGSVLDGCVGRISEKVAGLVMTEIESSGGAGVYETANLFENITNRYHTIVYDSSVTFDMVAEFIEPRFNSENTILGGIGVTVETSLFSNAKTLAAKRNQKCMVSFANFEFVSTLGRGKYNAIPLLLASEFAAKRSLRHKEGAIISDILATTKEYLGGISMATLPYHNTPMSYLSSMNEDEMDLTVVKELNDLGYTLLVNSDGYSKLGEVVTFYKKNTKGLEDNTYHYLNSIDAALAISEYFFLNLKNLTSQSRYTPDEISSGDFDIFNDESLKNELVILYQDLANKQITKFGGDYVNKFKDSLNISILDDNLKTINISGSIETVGQIRSIIFNISFS